MLFLTQQSLLTRVVTSKPRPHLTLGPLTLIRPHGLQVTVQSGPVQPIAAGSYLTVSALIVVFQGSLMVLVISVFTH